VTVDGNPGERSEAFLGGILACGCSNIDGCAVKITGYASLTGYMHTGCVVGMFHKHDLSDPKIYHIRNCTVEGTISGGFYVGGLVGDFGGEALQCMASADVVGGSNFAGGLIGRADGATVDQCYSLGTVSGGATNMGGLVGMAGETMTTGITDCYSMAAVAGIADDAARRVGGLIGSSGNCLITNCYSC
jgi:hypothetical protein